MANNNITLVTGVASYWGSRLAARLAAEPSFHIIGLDSEPLADSIDDLDFIQADIRDPLMVDLLQSEGVKTVCHLQFVEQIERREAVFDLNVMGTMKLLGACAEAGVEKVVLKSSTAVYGAHPDNSAFLTEQTPLRGSRNYGYTRDMVEIEAFCNGFRRQWPQIELTVLRFANPIGPTADTPMTRFLRQRIPSVLLGFDPVMQLIHEDDVVEALAFAAGNRASGIFNIGADGAMPLSRILRVIRKVPFPILHPLAYRGMGMPGSSILGSAAPPPIEWDYLRYPWVADLEQMRDTLEFFPLYLADEALREFAGYQAGDDEDVGVDAAGSDSERLRDILARRQRARERQAAAENPG